MNYANWPERDARFVGDENFVVWCRRSDAILKNEPEAGNRPEIVYGVFGVWACECVTIAVTRLIKNITRNESEI